MQDYAVGKKKQISGGSVATYLRTKNPLVAFNHVTLTWLHASGSISQWSNASVNSNCAHAPPPRANPRALAIFFS